jgi:hypothetical protein
MEGMNQCLSLHPMYIHSFLSFFLEKKKKNKSDQRSWKKNGMATFLETEGNGISPINGKGGIMTQGKSNKSLSSQK